MKENVRQLLRVGMSSWICTMASRQYSLKLNRKMNRKNRQLKKSQMGRSLRHHLRHGHHDRSRVRRSRVPLPADNDRSRVRRSRVPLPAAPVRGTVRVRSLMCRRRLNQKILNAQRHRQRLVGRAQVGTSRGRDVPRGPISRRVHASESLLNSNKRQTWIVQLLQVQLEIKVEVQTHRPKT